MEEYIVYDAIQIKFCTPIFIAELFIGAKTWKQLKCLWTDEWLKKKKVVCTYNRTLLGLKKRRKSCSLRQYDESEGHYAK